MAEIHRTITRLAKNHSQLVSQHVIGKSWEKEFGHGGEFIRVMKISNESIGGPKPRLLLVGGLHGDELATSELLLRFAETIIVDYNRGESDIQWMVDHQELHIVALANPDARKLAQEGIWARKNLNRNACFGDILTMGVDLNRNFAFNWQDGGSSEPCSRSYRGETAESEPEVRAISRYTEGLFPDRRGPRDLDPTPLDYSGLYIDVHSPGSYIAPVRQSANEFEFYTLQRKLAYYNGYDATGARGDVVDLLAGTSRINAYGSLGVPSLLLEIGKHKFDSCAISETESFPMNIKMLLQAFRITRAPFLMSGGPEVLDLSVVQKVEDGGKIVIHGKVSDDLFGRSEDAEIRHPIRGVLFWVNNLPWLADAEADSAAPVDGAFDEITEEFLTALDPRDCRSGCKVYFQGVDTMGAKGGIYSIDVKRQSS